MHVFIPDSVHDMLGAYDINTIIKMKIKQDANDYFCGYYPMVDDPCSR
jgi:glycerate kinase